MTRAVKVHYAFDFGGCGGKRGLPARLAQLTGDVTCNRCIYRLWRYGGRVSDYDPRITLAMRQHRIDSWRRAGLLSGRL